MGKKITGLFFILSLLVIGVTIGYLTINTYGNWAFAWALRSKKIMAFILVALATSSATVSFQTITQNQFLTPSVLGLDSLYVLVQTLLFFLIGGVTMLQQTGTGFFLVNVALMVGLSQLLFFFLLRKEAPNLFLLLMTGMILGTLFNSISTFLQVVMDPNEYDLLQGKLFASFGNVQTAYLLPAALLIGCCWVFLFYKRHFLDVFHLGKDQATNLGIETERFQFSILCCVSLLTGTATALVGPITFLGFIVANVSYRLFATYRHGVLLLGSFLIAFLFLTGGQLIVEQVFGWNTTVSVVVEFTGGIYFITKLIRERKELG
ncbi:iron chelate uptake ABC transporter family permease subunit [Enterococcus mundtii]|uniref:ABC transporter permease n=1 Tax=Enterococcus mundtii TaxID=53346 RepID=A0A1I4ML56_ENTMU|nr:iron chelate uptake ABC transporter family permease subunit [Enterococcus mundtii]GEN17181.1 ABC transporter permease [Ligilactobacillus acidipiscis]AUB54151.1 iron ABC transporter permease [Enterococcus mundtii]MDB7086247.1 iron chelate uptake ABC transporter family permease subunit [Enterococcus mundtii]MZZ58972.1 iron chelate uptake ABC transporter family permease subunit [Enterococcus mundtii]MZZ61903.1 iron chelate uptake ABC transporter family permease subunit [Enterococcus mundtii]